MRGNAKLRFCKVDDEIRPVSDFAHLPPKERPPTICYECDQPLVLKLGMSGKVVHHAAHKSDSRFCSLTNPESALHFNTKMYIFNQLKKGNKLFLKQSCGGWSAPAAGIDQNQGKRSCLPQKFNKYLWLDAWDEVQVERTVDSTRPDIVLYGEGKPVGAVEVFVTHAVDKSKKYRFRDLGLQWVEVKAEGDLFDEYFVDWAEDEDADDIYEFPWTIDKPLVYENCFPALEEWTCEGCLQAPEGFSQRQAEYENRERIERLKTISERRDAEDKLRKYTNKDDNKVLCARATLLLKRSAEVEYVEIFVIRRDNSEPPYKPEELYLKLGKYGGRVLVSKEPITDNSKEEINQFYKEWLNLQSLLAQEVVHVTKWVKESELDKLKANFTNPFKWHPILTKWVPKDETDSHS